MSKADRLIALGFQKSKEAKEGIVEKSRISNLINENNNKRELIETINYFSFKYPMYKFITEGSVKKICEKYGLVYGAVIRYTGSVPDKNLNHIENFKIDDNDKCCRIERIDYSLMSTRTYNKFISKIEFDKREYKTPLHNSVESYYECELEIAAPIKDFDMTGMEVKDNKIQKMQIPDPIVLCPVFFKNKKHYLIVTAWGDEASDELVVNQKMN
jgi:hypothetical protein